MEIATLNDLQGLTIEFIGLIYNSAKDELNLLDDKLKYTSGFFIRFTNGLIIIFDGGGRSGKDYKELFAVRDGMVIASWENNSI